MYKNILVPVAIDHGEMTQSALKVARHLAGADGQITALTVIEAIPSFIVAELPEGQSERNRQAAEEALREEVGEGVRAVVVTGHAGRTINDYAEEHGIDCIVIASHQPGLEQFFLGSTASRVVRHAHCAVHVVR